MRRPDGEALQGRRLECVRLRNAGNRAVPWPADVRRQGMRDAGSAGRSDVPRAGGRGRTHRPPSWAGPVPWAGMRGNPAHGHVVVAMPVRPGPPMSQWPTARCRPPSRCGPGRRHGAPGGTRPTQRSPTGSRRARIGGRRGRCGRTAWCAGDYGPSPLALAPCGRRGACRFRGVRQHAALRAVCAVAAGTWSRCGARCGCPGARAVVRCPRRKAAAAHRPPRGFPARARGWR